jgi:hypothetical protein
MDRHEAMMARVANLLVSRGWDEQVAINAVNRYQDRIHWMDNVSDNAAAVVRGWTVAMMTSAASGVRHTGGGFKPDTKFGKELSLKEVVVGDLGVFTNLSKTVGSSQLTGSPITKVGRVNLVVQSSFQASPTGPVFKHEHKVPVAALTHVIRVVGGEPIVHPIRR